MGNFEKNLEKALNNAKRLTDKILIDGKLISAQTNNKIPVLNPSTGDNICLLYTSPSPRDLDLSRMPSSA